MSAIVFDFDGTLLDSAARHTVVLEDCLREFGLSVPSLSDYLSCKADGMSTKTYLRGLGLSDELCRAVSERWVMKIEQPEYLKLDHLFDDAVSALELCKRAGFALYLLSARQSEENLLKQVHQTGVAEYFDKVYCVSPANASAEKTQVVKSLRASMVVGDTEVDWKAAEAGGAACYLLNRGFRSVSYWQSRGVRTFGSLSMLSEHIDDAMREN